MDYNFVTVDQFMELEKSGALLESGTYEGKRKLFTFLGLYHVFWGVFPDFVQLLVGIIVLCSCLFISYPSTL